MSVKVYEAVGSPYKALIDLRRQLEDEMYTTLALMALAYSKKNHCLPLPALMKVGAIFSAGFTGWAYLHWEQVLKNKKTKNYIYLLAGAPIYSKLHEKMDTREYLKLSKKWLYELSIESFVIPVFTNNLVSDSLLAAREKLQSLDFLELVKVDYVRDIQFIESLTPNLKKEES